jgi:HEAT repeat protein
MNSAFDDMELRDLVGLLTADEQKELRPSVLRVLGRLPSQEVLRRELGQRMTRV